MSSQVVVYEFKKGREAKLVMIFLHKKRGNLGTFARLLA